ncbi:2-C-methyl-D-erythritol 4-phosphate cytidylyltransferase [Marinilabilia rubra]|uniref:2-C-methyl-D-erythritol 4-phosphate cytidylyltransferase n=1 Tax=Marinilabilia rubra TaxID=2162893 RepID=A0A2U2BD75_9BACT|nr:2-C-methyl-D-erythritol 4-phosphate cytidylyltransferase [Marinilabilia rubra]PWE01024.1 2-C-methyl-D-erythritol 4-phosphate cytidylyltransferase [Marinilabilia rubra]
MSALSVIIVAGGRGLRMGHEVPKQFLNIGRRPVLMHTIEKFYSYDSAISVVLVLPSDQFPYWKALCRKHNFLLSHKLVEGGPTRYNSVKNGLAHIGDSDLVGIHDGVRPFVSNQTIERCYLVAQSHGAAIPVLEVVESIRKVEGDRSWMKPRSAYRTVQTPQVFKSSILKNAYDLPFNPDFTDDASVVEAAGYDITLVEGNRENIKITSPFDLVVADAMIREE